MVWLSKLTKLKNENHSISLTLEVIFRKFKKLNTKKQKNNSKFNERNFPPGEILQNERVEIQEVLCDDGGD